jgi:ferredoxin-NADP reductase
VLLTLPILDVQIATPRARLVRIDLAGHAFSYQPGQALYLSAHERGKRRPYSIALPAEEAARLGYLELLVGVESDGHPGPDLRLEAGTLVDIDGPRGRFTFPEDPAERRFTFIAGGTGIAPLRAMLHRALAVPHDHIGVLYSARTRDEFAFERELRALAERGEIDLRLTVTRDTGDEEWRGTRGRIGRADLERLVQGPDTLCFVCGPPALVHDIPRQLAEIGIPPERIKIEEWGSSDDVIARGRA